MNDKPRRASVGLDDVFQLRLSVFQPGGWVFENGFAEDFVELRSFDFLMASFINLEREFKKFGDVFAGFAASNQNWGVG